MSRKRGNALRALVCAGVIAIPHFALAQQASRQAQTPPASGSGAVRTMDAQISRDSAVKLARAQLGRRYMFGGTTPDGFDCSGFLKYLMRALGVDLPRTAAEQARVGTEVARDESQLRPGDILTFGRGNRVTHVGIYVGNGRFIHASSGQGRIVESQLDRPSNRLVRAWYGVRRMFADRDSATVPNTTVASTVKTPAPSPR
ncbi:MAG TPA: C40 family peptidase [Longimicrobium sp.]|nr:C40 family peptidase [Longimicrobium sp.]